jgi:hypothetical protein
MDNNLKKEIRDFVKKIVDKELSTQEKNVEKKINDLIKINKKNQEDDFLKIIKSEIEKINKIVLTKKDIKDLMVKAFVKQNKFMWEKSKFVTSYFNEL